MKTYNAGSVGEAAPVGLDIKKSAPERARVCSGRAAALLNTDRVRLSMLLALTAVLVSFVAGYVLIEALYELIWLLSGKNELFDTEAAMCTAELISVLFGTLCSLPLCAGAMYLSSGIASDTVADLRDIFSAFSGMRRFFAFCRAAFTAALPFIISVLLIFGSAYLRLTGLPSPAVFALRAVCVLCTVPLFLCSGRFITTAALYFSGFRMCSDYSPGQAAEDLKKSGKPALTAVRRITAGTIPGYLLSLITLAICYFAHFGPLFSLERAVFANDIIYEKQIRKEFRYE